MNDNPALFSQDQLLRLVPLSYPERALRILEQWINSSHLSPSVLMKMIENAYNIDNFDCNKVEEYFTFIIPENFGIFELYCVVNELKAYKALHSVLCQTVPVIHLQGNQYISELFHGATASFKDAALQLMPQFFHHAVQEQSKTGGKWRYANTYQCNCNYLM